MKPERSIIFVNTKHAAIRIWEFLMGNDYPAALISGDIHQNKREKLLKKFHDGEYAFLVATDVASRGLHIPDVTHVFNYDLPDLGEDYVHRIGRTARAGNNGHAISFACEDYAMNLMDIEMYIEKSIPTEQITSDLLVEPKPRKKMLKDKDRVQPRKKQARRGGPPKQGQKPRRRRPRNKKPTESTS
jgi:ATP-dependent RNA helicase RhlB